MFTGIIETLGEIQHIESDGGNIHYYIKSSISKDLKIDQSVSHDGVCLTVVGINEDIHQVTAIQETLIKSNLGNLKKGDIVNLERCTPANGRFDGHIVQGHVDQTATCVNIKDQEGSYVFTFEYTPKHNNITVEKGSITVNGISLTVIDSEPNRFSVAIIPYTLEHTNLSKIRIKDIVNIEFDIVGKYVAKIMSMRD
ncbi:riboflavin synthase [Sphingobacterium sp. UT-1RO-CII-1]|uniref:riboflavin synthase n=1 Tax=Sphingobacterium sp. UT-1RO-CII-1 TaxID=2995225 RepID=UPI00227B1E5F|nr:riboflavin synthase [Sphingobacterium sp. UT-1RO-CII-1]MCY4779535.1 riboflavin synthase [Sphingobacterium sp. UT-1RO-CII-1]